VLLSEIPIGLNSLYTENAPVATATHGRNVQRCTLTDCYHNLCPRRALSIGRKITMGHCWIIDDAALRRTRFRGKQGSIFHVTGLQPFLEHHLVREDMLEHPVVADVIARKAKAHDACVKITRKSSNFPHLNFFNFKNLRISSKMTFKDFGPRYALTRPSAEQ